MSRREPPRVHQSTILRDVQKQEKTARRPWTSVLADCRQVMVRREHVKTRCDRLHQLKRLPAFCTKAYLTLNQTFRPKPVLLQSHGNDDFPIVTLSSKPNTRQADPLAWHSLFRTQGYESVRQISSNRLRRNCSGKRENDHSREDKMRWAARPDSKCARSFR